MTEAEKMDALRQIFMDARVSEEQIEEIIQKLRLESVEDLVLYTEPEDYEEVGVTDKYSRRKLAQYAQDLKAERGAQKASRAAAAVEADLRAREQRETTVATLADIYTNADSWLAALKQENTLQFTDQTYIAGIRAVLATNIGMFEALPKLMAMLMDFAKKNARPVPRVYYDLQILQTERKFGLIVGAAKDQLVIEDVPIFASEEDMIGLIDEVKSGLIPKIMDMVKTVGLWHNLMMSRAAGNYFMSKTNETSGARYPNPAAIFEAGQELRKSINQTFAGNGIQKAIAICQQYAELAKALNNPSLPQAVGAVDRDAVLNTLGFNANAAAVRSEKHIVNFVLYAIKADQCTEENELEFCTGLFNLAEQVDWSGLTGKKEDENFLNELQTTAVPQLILGGGGYSAIPQTGQVASQYRQIQQMNGQLAGLEVRNS